MLAMAMAIWSEREQVIESADPVQAVTNCMKLRQLLPVAQLLPLMVVMESVAVAMHPLRRMAQSAKRKLLKAVEA